MDEEERRWLEGLLPRSRSVIERVASGADASEHTLSVQRLRGRRVRLRLVADVVDDDAEVTVSEPFDQPVDTNRP